MYIGGRKKEDEGVKSPILNQLTGNLLTSVPGSRDAPCYETKYRYFDFNRL